MIYLCMHEERKGRESIFAVRPVSELVPQSGGVEEEQTSTSQGLPRLWCITGTLWGGLIAYVLALMTLFDEPKSELKLIPVIRPQVYLLRESPAKTQLKFRPKQPHSVVRINP
jgi:hypothetical protein